jgi:hypothetical protein
MLAGYKSTILIAITTINDSGHSNEATKDDDSDKLVETGCEGPFADSTMPDIFRFAYSQIEYVNIPAVDRFHSPNVSEIRVDANR